MASTERKEDEIECMFCRKSFPTRFFHTHLEMCSQHEARWTTEADSKTNNASSTPEATPDAPFDIVVKADNGKQYDISGLHSHDTILNIKNKVHDVAAPDISAINLVLKYNDEALEDDKTLKHYNVKRGVLLYCILDAPVHLQRTEADQPVTLTESKQSDHQIFLRRLHGDTMELHTSTNESILDIKQRVYIEHGIDTNKQVFVFAGRPLNDYRSLSDYNIKPGSTIHLIVKFDGNPQIRIKTLQDKEYTVKGIDLLDNIENVKKRLQRLCGADMEQQTLIFAGQQLENSKSLKDYNIPYEAMLHLVIMKPPSANNDEVDEEEKKEEDAMITVRSLTGHTFSVAFKPHYTIGYIKSRVQDISDIPVGKQRLVFGGEELSDSAQCKECHIHRGATLQLILRIRSNLYAAYLDVNSVTEEEEDEQSMLETALENSKNEAAENSKNNDHERIAKDLFMASGMGKLTQILQSHLLFMTQNEKAVDEMLKAERGGAAADGDGDDALQIAKQKAIECEQEILLNIMMDVLSMADFMKQIVLMENVFNSIYTESLRNEQQIARLKHAPNMSQWDVLSNKQKDAVIAVENENIDSFVKLMFAAKNVHLEKFKQWLSSIVVECEKRQIRIVNNSGAMMKKLTRAFYKAFYVYKQNGYKRMTDVLRCSMVFDSFDDIYSVFTIISEKVQVLRVKDRFQPQSVAFGYRDILINFYCPGSRIVCELQLHHALFYKHKKQSHEIYKKARLFDYGETENYAYQYAQQYVRPKIGDRCVVDDDELTKELGDNDLNMNGKQLLLHWGLSKYVRIMIEQEGWTDPRDWQYLTETHLRDEMKFQDSHICKFMHKYQDWLQRKNQQHDSHQ